MALISSRNSKHWGIAVAAKPGEVQLWPHGDKYPSVF